jgi:hypothetical protein
LRFLTPLRTTLLSLRAAAIFVVVLGGCPVGSFASDSLASWRDGEAKSAIVGFVDHVTQEGSADYVPPVDRIAVFDNDGTLWCESPIYVQFAFALDRVAALAPQHLEWKDQDPFKSVLAKDMKGLAGTGQKGAMEIIAATHAGMTTDAFTQIVTEWLAKAQHPRFHRPYNKLVYQPMLELLQYLHDNGFKTYIVSGGGVEFMRPWAEQAYGIPPEQVIGSAIKLKYGVVDNVPVLMREPDIDFIDDRAGKPVGIFKALGKRPIAAFGNSDGDYEMIEWVTARQGASLGLFVHHTDADREYAYDRKSSVGQLNKGLDDAAKHGWVIVDMKKDWLQVFPQ